MKRKLRQVLFILSLLFLVFGLVCIAWAVWPTTRDAVSMNIAAGPLPGAPDGSAFASFADYSLNVAWPRRLRAGENGKITVYLREQQENQKMNQERPIQVVMVEPNLGSLSVEPQGQLQASLGPRQDLEFSWEVSGAEADVVPGQMIVSFGFWEEDPEDFTVVPVAVVDVEVMIIQLFGLQTGMIIWLGIIGLVFWGALFLLGRIIQH